MPKKFPADLEAAFAHDAGEPVAVKAADFKRLKADAAAVFEDPKAVPGYTDHWRLVRRVVAAKSKVSKLPCIAVLYDLSQLPEGWATKEWPVFGHLNDLTRGLLRRLGMAPNTYFVCGALMIYPVQPSKTKHADAFAARHREYIKDAPVYLKPVPAKWQIWEHAIVTAWAKYLPLVLDSRA
jgi:hypothetical protein